jgi:protein O-mannosyl-transferase
MTSPVQLRKFVPYFLLVLSLLVAVQIYRPGLSGPFIFDDGLNIVSNQHLRLQELSPESVYEAAFSGQSGLFSRPISMLSFAGNYFWDRDKVEPFPSAYSFKVVNLAIHLLNCIVVFGLVRLLAGSFRQRWRPQLPDRYPEWLALAVASAWLLHPLNLTGVLYVVQRMASLAALFTFAGLTCYVWGRQRLVLGRGGGLPAILVGLMVFTPLAALSKENGALLPMLMFTAEVTLFRFEAAAPRGRNILIGIFAIFGVLPIMAGLLYLALHPDWFLSAYAARNFTLLERVMTEARVMWLYLRLIVAPSTQVMGFYHDDMTISRSLVDPASTLPAVVGMLALPVVAWRYRRSEPLVAFGILFFLVGHGLESTIFPLEIIFEHRNYLPMFGVLLALFHLLLNPLQVVTTVPVRRLFAASLILLFGVCTSIRASAWADEYSLWSVEVEHHPRSPRTNIAVADVYANALVLDPNVKENNYGLARQYYLNAIEISKDNIDALIGLVQLDRLYGKPIESSRIHDLADILARDRVPPNLNERLQSMATCRLADECSLTAEQINLLFDAVLRNPRVAGRDRALIYSSLTFYLFSVVKDNAAALDAAQKAVELSARDVDLQLWVATILVAMHRNDEARKQIQILKGEFPRGLREKEISELEAQF